MTNDRTIAQLELSFTLTASSRPQRRPQGSVNTAQWWFAQMRAAVERAPDWQNHPPVRVALAPANSSQR